MQLYKIEPEAYGKNVIKDIHISSELHLVYVVSSNNDRHSVLRPSLHFTTLVNTSLLPI